MKLDETLWVEVLEAKPNPLFTEEQRQSIRFLRYSRKIPCAECGRKQSVHWTMLCSFITKSMGNSFFLESTGEVHPPLTPVCQEHCLQAEFMALRDKEEEPVPA